MFRKQVQVIYLRLQFFVGKNDGKGLREREKIRDNIIITSFLYLLLFEIITYLAFIFKIRTKSL